MKSTSAWCSVAAALCVAGCGEIPQSAFDEANRALADAMAPKASIRLVSMSVPPGSTLVVRTLEGSGYQEVPELRATVAVTADQNVRAASIQAFVATPKGHCIGATAGADLEAGVEAVVTTPQMNYVTGYGDPPACALPYTTTEVQVYVLRGRCDTCPEGSWASARFPATYHFAAR